jgi:hypothetical protein
MTRTRLRFSSLPHSLLRSWCRRRTRLSQTTYSKKAPLRLTLCKTSISVVVFPIAIGGGTAPGTARSTPDAITMIGRALGRLLTTRKLVAGGGADRALSGSLRLKRSSF